MKGWRRMKSYVIMALGSNREFNRSGNLLMIYGGTKEDAQITYE